MGNSCNKTIVQNTNISISDNSEESEIDFYCEVETYNQYNELEIYYTKTNDLFYRKNLDKDSYKIYERTREKILELGETLQNDYAIFDESEKNYYMRELEDTKELMKVFYKLACKTKSSKIIPKYKAK